MDMSKFTMDELNRIECQPFHPLNQAACDELDRRSGLNLRAQDEPLDDDVA
ncbi:hypothetical protein [Ralstonia phage RP13]|nr:hypothetical protein [Ralstonia phage RP13]